MKQNIGISLDKAILDQVDSTRGDIPRSRMLASLIAKGIELTNTTKKPKETGAGRQAQTPATTTNGGE